MCRSQRDPENGRERRRNWHRVFSESGCICGKKVRGGARFSRKRSCGVLCAMKV